MSMSSVSVCRPCAQPSGISSCEPFVGAQPLGVPTQKRRRAAPQVDGDVEDFATQAVDELGLGVRRPLKMQPAKPPRWRCASG